MIRRFNYTNRKRIPRRRVHIVIASEPKRELREASWDLADLGFPADAAVYLEGSSSGSATVARMAVGTVGRRSLPAERSLEELSSANIFFNLKVVDETDGAGRILGMAQQVRPRSPGESEADASRRSLLPVNVVDSLGDEVWRVDFTGPRPYLEVNGDIPGMSELVGSDPRFFSLVFPQAVRQILNHIVIVEGVDDLEGANEWQRDWLLWACRSHPDGSQLPEGDGETARAEKFAWTDAVASAFARIHRTRELFERGLESGATS
jgi:hypothetical protein